MGTVATGSVASGTFVPEAKRQFLPGCQKCHAPHPLAFSHWRQHFADNSKCPQCGESVQSPGPTDVDRAFWGFDLQLLIGRGLMAIGRFLNNRSKGL